MFRANNLILGLRVWALLQSTLTLSVYSSLSCVNLRLNLWRKWSTWIRFTYLPFPWDLHCRNSNYLPVTWSSLKKRRSSPHLQSQPGLLMLMSHPPLCCIGQVLGQTKIGSWSRDNVTQRWIQYISVDNVRPMHFVRPCDYTQYGCLW